MYGSKSVTNKLELRTWYLITSYSYLHTYVLEYLGKLYTRVPSSPESLTPIVHHVWSCATHVRATDT